MVSIIEDKSALDNLVVSLPHSVLMDYETNSECHAVLPVVIGSPRSKVTQRI